MIRLFWKPHEAIPRGSSAGSSIHVSYKTSQRYVGLLEQVFLISTLQPWYTNAIKRITKTAKLHFTDTALLAATRGLTFEKVRANRELVGALFESFAYSEVLKLMTGTELRLSPYHYRDQEMREVGIVLESAEGRLAGNEVKASATVRAADFKGLRHAGEGLWGSVCFRRGPV